MQKFSILENQLASDGKIQLFAFPSFADGNKNLQVDPFVVIMGRRIYSLKTLKPGGAFFLLFYTAELNQIWDNVNLRGALVTIADEKIKLYITLISIILASH